MRIDVHAHLWTDEYLDLLIRYGNASAEEARGLGADTTSRDLDARFAMMDAASVDLQVLSASPQLPSFQPVRARRAGRRTHPRHQRPAAARTGTGMSATWQVETAGNAKRPAEGP